MGKVAIHYGWIPMILYIGMLSSHSVKSYLQDTHTVLLGRHFGGNCLLYGVGLIAEWSYPLVD